LGRRDPSPSTGRPVTVRPIRLFGDPVLRHPCATVTRFDDALAALVTDLTETCRLPGRAGLAAPQIGVGLRVFCYNIDTDEGYVVNPELVHLEGEQEGDEGCLSVPDLFLPTPRAARAVVRGVDIDNRPVEVEGTELMARCLQHEVDHLDGRLYIDRLSKEHRREAMKWLRNLQLDSPAPSEGRRQRL
jgi:peptide deformylase